METGSIKARIQGKQDILPESFLCGRSVDAVRIESLIQYQSLKDGFSVYKKFFALDFDFPHAKVAVYPVFHEG